MVRQEITDEYVEGFFKFLQWADSFLFLALILIVADLFFGVKAALRRKEKVRRSRAIRRSIDKICAYVLWILVAYSVGEVFDISIESLPFPIIAIGIIYFIEIESIYKNYFEWQGINIKINLLKFFTKKTGGIIEIKKEEVKEDEKDI